MILAIDVGSSSVRSSIRDLAGNAPREDVRLPHSLEITPDGGATKDAEGLFGLFTQAVDEALEQAANGRHEISGVAVSTFWHALLGVDGNGRPATPVFAWADRRAAVHASELRQRLDLEGLHKRTGCVPHSSYLPAKLLWLAEEAPEAFARTERWISPGEYFYLRLFGRDSLRVGVSMASATGLMHQNGKTWDEPTLAALPIRKSQLSPISEEPHEGLVREWARRWPALAGVPWFPAAGDGACSNAGVGSTTLDSAALMIGTSGAMRVLWKAASVEIPDGLWCYRADATRFVAGGALSDGGNLVAWLQNTLRLPELDEAEEEIASREPGSHGLDFLPLLAGERGPRWSDQANGAITGLSMATTPTDILHAAMEAVALRFALISHSIEEGLPVSGGRRIVATGGGISNSPSWARMMANALGHPIHVSGAEEASSRGAALLAAERLGGVPIEKADSSIVRTIEPDAKRHEEYLAALERQKALYESLVRRG